MKKKNLENEQFIEQDIYELCQKALEVVSVSRYPRGLVEQAKKQYKEKYHKRIADGMKKITSVEENVHWNVICEVGNHSWWIEQNKNFGQFRLIGGENKETFFSIQIEEKLENFLTLLIEIGTEKNAKELVSSMTIIQIVVDDYSAIKEGCIKLHYNDVKNKYPDTKEFSKGFYTIHPCNPNALVPVENFFTNLALDKDNECILLLGKMGAKSVHISHVEDKSMNESFGISYSGEIERKKKENVSEENDDKKKEPIKVSAGFAIGNQMNFENDYEVTFEGNKTEISPDILQNSMWHKNDPKLNALLESLQSHNPITSETIKHTYHKSFDFDFKAAARVLDSNEIELKNEFEKTSKITKIFAVVF